MVETRTIVIRVPEGASPEEESQLLSAPGDAYFLVQALPMSDGYRAFFRRYKAPAKSKTETASDAVALSIIQANRNKPVRAIVSLLEEAGVKRGRHWVSDQLTAKCADDGREDEAVAFLKERPSWPEKEVVQALGWEKIKRTTAWVRQKRNELMAAVPVPALR